MNIGIDVDGTLTDLNGFMRERGEKFFHRAANDPTAFEIDQMFACSKKERNLFWAKYLIGYCLSMPIIDGAAQTIRQLKNDGHKIYIITSRVNATKKGVVGAAFRSMLKRWLKRKGVPFDGIAYCEDSGKSKLRKCRRYHIDVMIDDKPENIKEISEKFTVIGHPMPWNRTLTEQGYDVAKDWADIYAKIDSMAKRRKTEGA